MGWGSLNHPKHSIHLKILAQGVGTGEVGMSGLQPNVVCKQDQNSIKSHKNWLLKRTILGLGPIYTHL